VRIFRPSSASRRSGRITPHGISQLWGVSRVVLEEKQDEKIRLIDEIYRSVLERDVAYLLRVEKTEAFSNLIKVLAGQIGNLINYKELSSTLGISFPTLKKYLWYARKIFLLDLVTPYSAT